VTSPSRLIKAQEIFEESHRVLETQSFIKNLFRVYVQDKLDNLSILVFEQKLAEEALPTDFVNEINNRAWPLLQEF